MMPKTDRRYMRENHRLSDRVRDLRREYLRALLSRGRADSEARAALAMFSRLAAAAIIAGITLFAVARAQAETPVCDMPSASDCADDVALRRLGLTLSGLGTATDADRLWQAARDLALTGAVSEMTQQAIWRQLWRVEAIVTKTEADDPYMRDFAAAAPLERSVTTATLQDE